MEHIFWLTQTSAQIPDNDDWLSETEQKTLAGFRFPKRRNDWRLGRWTAKQAVHAFQKTPDAALCAIEIPALDYGAPEVILKGQPAGISISISHCRDRALCAIAPADTAIGCDLEWIEPREKNFAEDYFTPEEISLVKQSPAEKALLVTLIWSAKEAALKAIRKGLSRDTRSVVISPDFPGQEGSWNRWTGHCLESACSFYGWWRICDGYVYTLASDKPTMAPVALFE
jgi:4'-phosphopantetheinyl transferase